MTLQKESREEQLPDVSIVGAHSKDFSGKFSIPNVGAGVGAVNTGSSGALVNNNIGGINAGSGGALIVQSEGFAAY